MWKYLDSVRKLWGKRLAGPVMASVAILLTIIVPTIHDPSIATRAVRWGAWTTAAGALIMWFVASYDAWCIEHNRYVAEAALHEEDRKGLEEGGEREVRMERDRRERELAALEERREREVLAEREKYEREAARNARPELHGEISNVHRKGLLGSGGNSAFIGLACDVYVTNLCPAATNLRSIHLDGSALVPPLEFSVPILTSQPGLLEPGIGQSFQIEVEASFKGHSPSDFQMHDLAALRVYVTDGFGGEHSLSVRLREQIRSL